MTNQYIEIHHAYHGNLKNISLRIPRNQITVLTGVSGSGKSTLAIDVLYQECQRQYLEAMAYQGINKPLVEDVLYTSPAIQITPYAYANNPRSTVGTISDVYTDLRMIYEKIGERECPFCHKTIRFIDCLETVEKENDQFIVYNDCPHCQKRIHAYTRSHFSFNTKEGACPTCHGLGQILSIKDNIIDENLSFEEGAIPFFQAQYKDYQLQSLYHAFDFFGIDYHENTKIKDYTPSQKDILLYGVKSIYTHQKLPKTVKDGLFEGVHTYLMNKVSKNKEIPKQFIEYFEMKICPDCHGERLNQHVRQVKVMEKRLPELYTYSLEQLYEWICSIDIKHSAIDHYILDIKTKLKRYIRIGLGYLTLDRQVSTLSGGETQRMKLASVFQSTVTNIIYILDEPTIGLHPHDTQGIIDTIMYLKQLGNTIVVIEHDEEMIKMADYIIDIGLDAGKKGGSIVYMGDYKGLLENENSYTAKYLSQECFIKKDTRPHCDYIHIVQASCFNIHNLNVSIPKDVFTCVTGVSGSGKSTLCLEVLAKQKHAKIQGLETIDEIITIQQNPISRMKRSNVATYSGVYQYIRQIYASLDDAKKNGLSSTHFSFNSPGGRCEHCQGLGYVTNQLLFFEDTEVECPICHGQQFHDDVLSVKWNDYSIHDLLQLSIDEVIELFKKYKKIFSILSLLQDVGLGYLQLGQSLTTLSNGEGQRLKLARDLISTHGQSCLYIIDEPTTGLHFKDIEHFIVLLNRMVDDGHTVIVIEHNIQLIKQADWIIDMGPLGGDKGGQIIAEGTPLQIQNNLHSLTGKYLKNPH